MAGLAVTAKGHIVAVDSVSPTVFVISEEENWFAGSTAATICASPPTSLYEVSNLLHLED